MLVPRVIGGTGACTPPCSRNFGVVLISSVLYIYMGAEQSAEASAPAEAEVDAVAASTVSDTAAAQATVVSPTELILKEADEAAVEADNGTASVSVSNNTSSSSSLSSRFLSWRPAGFRPPRKKAKHTDPKKVYEGLQGLSLQAALNQPDQLKHVLSGAGVLQILDAVDSDGDRSALHWAAARGFLGCVKLLVDAGALKDVKDAQGHTPASLADLYDQPEVKAYLLHVRRATAAMAVLEPP